MTSHYDTLGIARTATAEDVKRAYRKLAKQFHPDHNSGDKHAEERFLEISLAYEVLSDAGQRKSYDLNFGMGTYSFKEHKNIRHFFEVTADKTEVKVCEEFELTFTYSGEGRYLRKPEMEYFFITGKPFVHFRKIKIDGHEVKETSIAYTVCATAEGRHRLGEAFIKIDNKAYHSAPIYIKVNASECFYSTKQITANGKPYRYKMFYVAESGGHAYRYSQNHRHTVLIPRSHKAKVVHDIGSGLKIVFTIWGLLLSASINLFPVAGAVLGSVYGALNAYILYWIMGVKPKFYFSNQYAAVRDLLEKGFLPGDETSSNYKIARVISLVSRVVV